MTARKTAKRPKPFECWAILTRTRRTYERDGRETLFLTYTTKESAKDNSQPGERVVRLREVLKGEK